VHRAGILLVILAAFIFVIFRWLTPIAIVFWPPIMILGIAVLFGTGLLRAGPVVLTIDESGVYDARIMKNPIPWSAISHVEEWHYRGRLGDVLHTLFVLKADRWEEWMKRPALAKILARAIGIKGIALSAAGLEYTTEGLRDTFRNAKAAGFLKS
jgi:hypothetical protein